MLLHELGHNLGVSHEVDADTIMNAMYSEHSSSFSPHARETMLATIEARLAGREPRAAGITSVVADHHTQLVITVTAAGKIVDGRPISDADLDVLLRNTGAADPDTEVIVKKERGLPPSAITQLFDRAKAAGLQRLSMASP